MFLYQIHANRWSATAALSGSITVKDEATSVQIELTPDEAAELDGFGSRVFARQQNALIAQMRKPLETALLADWSEVSA